MNTNPRILGSVHPTKEGGYIKVLSVYDNMAEVQDVDEYQHTFALSLRRIKSGNHKNLNRRFEMHGHTVYVGYGRHPTNTYTYTKWLNHLAKHPEPALCFQDFAEANPSKKRFE